VTAGAGPDSLRDNALAAGETADVGLYKPVDLAFSDFFDSMGLCHSLGTSDRSNSNTWAHGHVLAGSVALRTNTFSRVDLISHLNASFNGFVNADDQIHPGYPVHPGGRIYITVRVNLGLPAVGAVPLASDLRAYIITTTTTHPGQAVRGDVHEGSASFVATDKLTFILDSGKLTPWNLDTIAIRTGRLNPSLMGDVSGLHGWNSVRIRKLRGPIDANEVCPVDGYVRARFVTAPPAPGDFDPEDPNSADRRFIFDVDLKFVRDPEDEAGWIVSRIREGTSCCYSWLI
jgi:hypothetical protein